MMNLSRPLILASNSPRRQELLREAGFDFTVKTKEVDETYPPSVPVNEIAGFLARKKARAYKEDLPNSIVLTADTIVKLKNEIMGKPADYGEAKHMLTSLSGTDHEVITGVCIATEGSEVNFSEVTRVWFRRLTEQEIHLYITEFRPFDKAGAYGIQEWIGMIGIEKIEGSYFNVVGLPVHRVYEALLAF